MTTEAIRCNLPVRQTVTFRISQFPHEWIANMQPRFNLLACLWFFGANFLEAHAADKPNVLFIAIDDQNDWIGHLAV